MMWGLKKFDFWLCGAHVTVVSDHNTLAFLTLTTPPGGKTNALGACPPEIYVVVQHRKGSAHANADALSRVPNTRWDSTDSSAGPGAEECSRGGMPAMETPSAVPCHSEVVCVPKDVELRRHKHRYQ